MTNANKEVYEAKILETLIKNNERLAVIEERLETNTKSIEEKIDTEVKSIKQEMQKTNSKLNWIFAFLIAILTSIIGSILAKPII